MWATSVLTTIMILHTSETCQRAHNLPLLPKALVGTVIISGCHQDAVREGFLLPSHSTLKAPMQS